MSKESFTVNILPEEVLQKVKNNMDADLIHEELHHVDNRRTIGTLVFEKYYFRVKNRVALIVIADNLSDNTNVRLISTAGSEGVFLNFDWGASDSFIGEAEEILNEYTL